MNQSFESIENHHRTCGYNETATEFILPTGSNRIGSIESPIWNERTTRIVMDGSMINYCDGEWMLTNFQRVFTHTIDALLESIQQNERME